MKNTLKTFAIAFVVTASILYSIHLLFGQESYAANTNAVVIQDTCLVVNWDATPEELAQAVTLFNEKRSQ